MSTSTKGLLASYRAVHYDVTEKTTRLFMLKIQEAMSSNENFPMDDEVHFDEFVLRGKEANKAGGSYSSKKKMANTEVQHTEDGKV